MFDIKALPALYRLDSLGRARQELTSRGMGGEALNAAYRQFADLSARFLDQYRIPGSEDIFRLEYPVTDWDGGSCETVTEHLSFGTDHPFAFRLCGNSGDRAELVRILQGIVMQVLTGVQKGDLRLVMIDPVNGGADLGMLNRIAAADETFYGGRVFTRDMEAAAALDGLQTVLEENIRRISGAGSETAYDHNRTAEHRVPLYLLVLCGPDSLSGHTRKKIDTLQGIAHRGGLSILSLEAPDAGAAQVSESSAWNMKANCLTLREGRIEIADEEHRIACAYTCTGISEAHVAKVLKEKEVDSLASHNLDLGEIRFREAPAGGLRVPFAVDRNGQLVELEMGTAVSAHMLISGTSGSGKSSALHAIILSMCMHYHPDDLEIWAIDYKAVEFAVYVRRRTPHISVIGQDNSHEFSTSLLDMVQEEYTRRKRLFMQAHVENFKEYRSGGHPLSRIVIVIDEFHNLTQAVKDQPRYRDMLETQLRELRAMGMSYIFCSQTISSGLQGLTEAARQQIGVRVCMKQIAGEEVRATIPDMGADSQQHIRAVLDFGVGQLLYRKPRDSGGYDYLYARGLFFTDAFREQLIDRVLETVGDHYTPRPETICKDSERYDIREKPRHALNRYIRGGDMPEGEDGILLYPGAPTDLRDDLSVYLECAPGNNLLLCVGDRELRESAALFTVMSLLSSPDNEVHLHFLSEHDRAANSLRKVLSGLRAENLHLYQGAEESFRHILTLDQLRRGSGRQIEIYAGLEKLDTAAEDLESRAAEEEKKQAAMGGAADPEERQPGKQSLLDANRSDAELLNDIDALLARFKAEAETEEGKSPASGPSSGHEKKTAVGSGGTAGRQHYEAAKIRQILQQSFERGPDRGIFSIGIYRSARQVRQSGIGRLENFEYRIGGQMSADDAYTLFGSEYFAAAANERTLVLFAGSVKNGRTIRPYLMPDAAYIADWNRRRAEDAE